MEKALFAAGCFWGIQEYFDSLNGVNKTYVGYSGGITKYPTYENVCNENTGHAEVVYIEYNENIISYNELLNHFWQCHDPTSLNRQGPDIGSQYRSVIFYYSDEQKKIALESKQNNQNNYPNKIVTEIIKLNVFYKAEDYHQKYIKKTKGYCSN